MRPFNCSKRHRRFVGRQVLFIGAAALGLTAGACTAGDEPTKLSIGGKPDQPGASPSAAEHPLVPFLKKAKSSLQSISALHDYKATFFKQELVKSTLYADQMFIKFRSSPFSVYLRFSGKNAGREVLYVAGQNQGKLLVHEGSGISSIVGTMQLDPKSPRVMAEGRHPIMEIGMQNMVEALIRQWEAELKSPPEAKQFYSYYPEAAVLGTPCEALESIHPHPQPRQFHITRVWIDKKTNFPVRLQQWGIPDSTRREPYIIEDYVYTKIETNIGLSDTDFNARNRTYRFY